MAKVHSNCLLASRTVLLLILLFPALQSLAIEEPYINALKGRQVAKDSFFVVADEKFGNSSADTLIHQNYRIDNLISFEINFDTTINFYNKPFQCAAKINIYLFGNAADTSEITDSITNITLDVKYDTVSGKPYKGIALYKFVGSRKYAVKIMDLTSAQLSPIPAIFRLKGQIIINRDYIFINHSTDVSIHHLAGSQLQIYWSPAKYRGAEMFDLEYTHIDDSSDIARTIRTFPSGDEYAVPDDSLALWFHNNSTRITASGSFYQVDVPYSSGFILYRIRGVMINQADGMRWEGDWNYRGSTTTTCESSCPAGVVHVEAHEPTLNWQYSVAFAEEGKRKEVMSYFDGTMHNRQAVTLSNSENKTIVQETIYDALGRATINVLPVPATDSTIHYFKNFNQNSAGQPYSFVDFSAKVSCDINVAPMIDTSGASKYYSANNPFQGDYYFSKYVPKAEGYPFAVTEYLADNTGRASRQGGVGSVFQLNGGHETKYYYGKPDQKELDRLFGSEAGNASHYLKNMVMDANGQLSVSYVDAAGRTIATALAGGAPANLHALPSTAGALTQKTDDLMRSEDFIRDPSNFSISNTTTFLAPVTGSYGLHYKVDPLKLESLYGPQKDSVICSSCYYDVDIVVKDNCGTVMAHETHPAGTIFDTTCSFPEPIQDTMLVTIDAIGSYYVNYSLRISKEALNYFDSAHFSENSDIRTYGSFLREELKSTDFSGCYNNCETCAVDLGTATEFFTKFKTLYDADSIGFGATDSLYVLELYDSLYSHCQAIQGQCVLQSPCDEKLELLKMDVMPGGQYAMYDSTNHLLEIPVNVLAKRTQLSFLPDGFGGRDSVMLRDGEGMDSIKVDAIDLNDSLFLLNWKDRWVDSLVTLHPEYCFYKWCLANRGSAQFDRSVEAVDADSASALGWFDHTNYASLLNHDPFFDTTYGKGGYLYHQMADSLRLFSRTMMRFSQSDKNILQVIDRVLYCNDREDGWEQCTPDSGCRSRQREWQLYSQMYLNLKKYFNEKARREDASFAECVNCFVGTDPITAMAPVTQKNNFSLGFDYVANGERYCLQGCLIPLYKNSETFPKELDGKSLTFYVALHRPLGLADTIIRWNTAFVLWRQLDMQWSSFRYNDPLNPETLDEMHYDSVTLLDVRIEAPMDLEEQFGAFAEAPDGYYTPKSRDSVSYYIKSGVASEVPSGIPTGYGNGLFYKSLWLQTADTTYRFFDVWQFSFDSTCGGLCQVDTVMTHSVCDQNGYDSVFLTKSRRYPEYVNSAAFINSALTVSLTATDASESIKEACHENCVARADYWMSRLSGCAGDSLQMETLKTTFIQICSASCSGNNSSGASDSVGLYTGPTPFSFEDAIRLILGDSAVNSTCTQELLGDLYPSSHQPVLFQRTLMQSDSLICLTVANYQAEFDASGYVGTFLEYMQHRYGQGFGLDSVDWQDLLHSCNSCNHILTNDIPLPIVFEPGHPQWLACETMSMADSLFHEKFPGLDSLNIHYEELYTNFMNHQFGFSLKFDDYMSYRLRCVVETNLVLVNRAAQEDINITVGDINACTAELFATALNNARMAYVVYADSVHKQFRDLYLTKCFNVQPSLKMSADLYEYHYTLYYYDQSGNLVKTVPPEGIKLLTDEQVDAVQLHRQRNSESCFQHTDSIHFNNDGYGEFANRMYIGTEVTMEASIQLSNYNDQVLLSHLYEMNLGFPVNPYVFYGYVVSIDNQKLKLTMNVPSYVYDSVSAGYQGSINGSISRTSVALSELLPVEQWHRLAVTYANNEWHLYINGNPVALQAVSSLEAPVIANTILVGAASSNYPEAGKLQGSMKNLRIYNRVLSTDEISQNAFVACGQPLSQEGMMLWAPLTAATEDSLVDLVGEKGTLSGIEWTPAPGIYPDHYMATTYGYNSLNQVIRQKTPDAGESSFFYDRLGRIIASENAKQSFRSREDHGGYTITEYDALGRITQVAEKRYGDDIIVDSLFSNSYVQDWMQSGERSEITTTIYDQPMLPQQSYGASRRRVTTSIYQDDMYTEGDTTFYTYDISGNVKTLIQYIKGLADLDPANGYKSIGYDYDLVSGKVNQVKYQEGKGDQFFHRYQYDADNRITQVLTSRDKLVWTEDASYRYYLHGPLARTELGNLKVQGVDYAYTLQGWLKAINGDALNPQTEMGQDGKSESMFGRVSRDAYAFKLGYYQNDYLPVGGSGAAAASQYLYTAPTSLANTGNQLFNGNISYTTLALSKFDTAGIKGYTYGYDQLNRLVEMRQHDVIGAWNNSSIIYAYRESIAYDANGNIERYLRKGANQSGMPLDMDSLTYRYTTSEDGRKYGNKLNYVSDAVSNSNYAVDIDDQEYGNYQYDVLGNLVADASEHLAIEWNLYGKIRNIQKQVDDTSITLIEYGYDPGGNRTWKKIGKHVWSDYHEENTFYVRDAQGNVMATYTKKDSEPTLWTDLSLYGSGRLGLLSITDSVPPVPPIVTGNTPLQDSLLLGSRTYELTNHLGNVLVTLSDKKIGVPSITDSALVKYYLADVYNQNDYYTGGMALPGRTYAIGDNNYRYSINGQEKTPEIAPNTTTAEFWQYDARIVRRWNVDPMSSKYPDESPYLAFHNNPVFFSDPLGDDPPEGLKKLSNTVNSKPIFLPQSATTETFEKGDREKAGILRAFNIGKTRFVASYDPKTRQFLGYLNAKTSEAYQSPDIKIKSGGITGNNLDVTFNVTGVPAASLQLVQTVHKTGMDAPFQSATINGVPFDAKGMVPGSYFYKDGGTDMQGNVDGGAGSLYALTINSNTGKPNGESYPGMPYYYSSTEAASTVTWNKNSGTIRVFDAPNVQHLTQKATWTSIIVATNYMGTGKDLVLGTFRWGWTNKGASPIHTGVSLVGNKPNSIELNTIRKFYGKYQFFQ